MGYYLNTSDKDQNSHEAYDLLFPCSNKTPKNKKH